LKAWKAKADKTCSLVLPTTGCNPKLNFLDDLKAVAERAKLDPEDFWLHKFRATFATRCLWAGVDLRTVQQWLGHSDMESTMRYLKPSRNQQVRKKVNKIFALWLSMCDMAKAKRWAADEIAGRNWATTLLAWK
jgi:site-specific recombinase XerD